MTILQSNKISLIKPRPTTTASRPQGRALFQEHAHFFLANHGWSTATLYHAYPSHQNPSTYLPTSCPPAHSILLDVGRAATVSVVSECDTTSAHTETPPCQSPKSTRKRRQTTALLLDLFIRDLFDQGDHWIVASLLPLYEWRNVRQQRQQRRLCRKQQQLRVLRSRERWGAAMLMMRRR